MKDDLKFNIKFIEFIQERPCLYDYNRSDYSNRNSQDAAWMEIAKKLNESVADCKERWKNLRGCYTRHLKNNNQPSGSSAKRVKPYYLAEQLQFLDSFTKSRPQKSIFKLEETSTEEEHETTNETDKDSEYSHGFDATTPDETATNTQNDENFLIPNKKYKKNKHVSLQDVNASALSYFEAKKLSSSNKVPEKQDPDLAFLNSLLPEIHDMTREQKRNFKIRVLQLIGDIFQSGHTNDGSALHSPTASVIPQKYTPINVVSDNADLLSNNSELPSNEIKNFMPFQSKIFAKNKSIIINKDGTLRFQQ